MRPLPPPSRDASPRSNLSRKENRAWPRFPGRFRTYCQSIKEDEDLLWSVQINDLSRQGLRIISHRRFEPGTILRVGLIHEKDVPLVVRAVHVTPTPEGDWSIGCTFPHKLEEDELRLWLQEKP
jgi:hypothetical protein